MLESNEHGSTDGQRTLYDQKRLGVNELDHALVVLSRVREEIYKSLEAKVEQELGDKIYHRVVEKISNGGDVAEVTRKELGERLRTIGAVASGLLILLGVIGVQSIQPLIENKANEATGRAVTAALEHQRNEMTELRMQLTSVESSVIERKGQILDSFNRELGEHLRQASRELSEGMATSKEELKKFLAEQRTDIDQTGKSHREAVEATANSAQAKITNAVESAEKMLGTVKNDAIQSLSRAQVQAPPAKTEGHPSGDRTDDHDQKNLEEMTVLAEAFVLLEERRYDEGAKRAKGMADNDHLEAAIALTEAAMMNPERFQDEILVAGQLRLDGRRSAFDRAQVVTDVLITGFRAQNKALIAMAMEEFSNNALARLAKSEFDEFVIAVLQNRPKGEIEKKFDKVTVENVTGTGLTNMLALAKLASISTDRIRKAEERLLANVTSQDTIDRNTDYPLAWHIATTLTKPPSFDQSTIRQVAQRIESYVFDDDHQVDPWGLQSLLASMINRDHV